MLFLNTLPDHMGLISLFVFLHAVYHKALHLFNKKLCNNTICQREFIAALFLQGRAASYVEDTQRRSPRRKQQKNLM